ncbi:hypothetical protein Btru_047999 [Bulinus truncatus]|nr:hypothetical protein Btru_047999 [Bulinus truncatus]
MENEQKDKLFIEQRGRPECGVQHEMRASQGRPQPQPRKSLPIGPTGADHTQSTMTDNTVTPGARSQTNSLERNRDTLANTDSEVNRMDFQCSSGADYTVLNTVKGIAKKTRICFRFLYKKTRLEIDLLLIGKTGFGKSALGNSILGRNAFESKPSTRSVTKHVTYELSEYNGKVIKVVDGPGVCDTDMSDDEVRNFVVVSMSYAIALNPKGYHAFLLVVKFGERFTRESRLTIDVLKKVFGESFVRKYCILVMTHGDQFEEETSFRDWLSEQRGDLMDLVRECGDRIILYDNKTKEKEKREGLLNTLLDMVQILALENCRYTDEQFEEARQTRESMVLESRKTLIEDEAMTEASLILKKLQSLQADIENVNNPKNLENLQQLLRLTATLLNNLREQDQNTGVLQDMISHVQSLQNSINDEIRLVQRISALIRNDNEEVRKAVTEKIRLQKLMFHQSLVEGSREDDPRQQNKDTEPDIPSDHETEINVMNQQWTATRKLEAEQKEMRTKKNKRLFSAIQSKICAALKRKIKEKH